MAPVRTPEQPAALDDSKQYSERFELRLRPDQRAAYEETAVEYGMSQATWMRLHLDAAAKTKAPAAAPIALKNAWAIEHGLRAMFATVVANRRLEEETVGPKTELLRSLENELAVQLASIKYLILYLMDERAK